MTRNHSYNTPESGTTDWHLPLNENFDKLDNDVEVRDASTNRDNYDPKDGAKFFATDTGKVYLGDGDSWNLVNGKNGSPDTIYVNPGDDWVPIVENADAGDIIWFRPGEHKDTTHSDSNEGPVLINTDDLTIQIAAGAVVKARDGLNEEERFIRVISDNVTFRGEGMLDGNAENSDGMAGVGSGGGLGHEHIIDLYDRHGSNTIEHFTLDGLTLKNAGGGDGIYLNGVEHAVLNNFRIDNATRNGISIIDAEDILISNFLIENTSGAAPRTGLAFEQNGEGEKLNRILVSDGITKNNANHGAYVNTHFTDHNLGTSTTHISFQNVIAEGNSGRGFSWHGTSGAERVHLSNCAAIENGKTGFYMAGDGKIRLDSCTARNNGASGDNTAHDVGIVAEYDEGNQSPADVWVNGFEVYDDAGTQKHPGVALHGSTLRMIDVRVGDHTYSQDGFRANGTGSTVEYALIDVESGDSPAFSTNGGSTTAI